MKITILGAGMVGGTLGERFAQVGHQIYFGVPSPQNEKYQRLLQPIGQAATVGTIAEAVRNAEVVVLATPWPATQAALAEAGDLSGKIIMDCTNPLQADASGLLNFFHPSSFQSPEE